MADRSKAFAWNYYDKNDKEESAKCKKCNAKIMCRGWSTSGLLRHLKNKHAIEKPPEYTAKRFADDGGDSGESSVSSDNKRKPSQTKITSFLKQDTREQIVSKLVAVDGFSVNAITNSSFIREALRDKGYSLPRNPNLVMEIIYKQYDVTKAKMKQEICDTLKMGSRFSLSIDEYSSLRNKRYLNINVHADDRKFWNLGMVAVVGRLTAEKTVKAVEDKLAEFDLSLEKHVVACTTDGASVMVKVGRLINCEHHLCYAHGIHLAVCDVLYKKTSGSVSDMNMNEDSESEEEIENCDHDFDTAVDFETEENSFLGTMEINDRICDDHENNIETVNVSEAISKVRKIVKLIRKSPLKNETLQNYVKSEYNREKVLILDSKTRWNSLLAMLDRFLEIKSAVAKTLIDYKIKLDITDREYTALNDIVLALQPVKAGAERLCSRDATLLSAEGVFTFIINELNELIEQNSVFAKKMKESLINRINERRSTTLVGLLQYLNAGQRYNIHASILGLPTFPKKSSLVSFAKKMLSRLFEIEMSAESGSDWSESEEEGHSTQVRQNMTLNEKLEAAIRSKTKSFQSSVSGSLSVGKYFGKELEVFEATGDRTLNITNLLNSLKSIPPTSVESERAFSAAGLFVTKMRTRLSDRSVDCLCYLRAYYKNSIDSS